MRLPQDAAELEAGGKTVDRLSADVCVVGGGMAGIGAALSAARQGARVVLVQDLGQCDQFLGIRLTSGKVL